MKVFFLLLALLLLVVLLRSIVAAPRFQHRFDDSSTETAERLQRHLNTKSPPEQRP